MRQPRSRRQYGRAPRLQEPVESTGKNIRAVNHSRGEYQRQNADGSQASTNTAESFFSLLKRAIIGAWHHISREHLPQYANEFAFRWNTRHDRDGKRLENIHPLDRWQTANVSPSLRNFARLLNI